MSWSVSLSRAFGREWLLGKIGLVLMAVAGVAMIAVPVRLGLGARVRPNLTVHDPGVRGGAANAGGPLQHLATAESTYFTDGQTDFNTTFSVLCGSGGCTSGQGLGPVFNENQCSSCHAQPAVGGGSPGPPATNPLFSVYQLEGAQNTMPSFETQSGPALVARVPFLSDGVTPDGSVHQLFTIAGRSDAGGCTLPQPVIPSSAAFHQPLPIFGDGYLEIYDNTTLTANMSAVCAQTSLGICGTAAISPNDGSVMRFGWKAQWRGLTLAAGEEYNSELGVTNEFFPTELNQTTGCQLNPFP